MSAIPVMVKVAGGQRVQVGFAVQEGDALILTIGQMEAARTAAAPAPRASSGGAPTTFPPYGRSKGAPIAGASREDLEYYAAGSRRSLADASKERFHPKEREMLAAIEAEMQRQGFSTGGDTRPRPSFMDAPAPTQSSFTAPAPVVDDIPF